MTTKPTPYTWLSTVILLALVFYLYLNGNRDIASFYHIPEAFFLWHWQLSAMTASCLILWLDIHRFYRRQHGLILENNDLKTQIQTLSDSKKQLQNKAHTYSGQADKLKLFISDRLLEYIEYDEKFLHFRGIAAEVRHNGIICYDKVLTALNTAKETTANDRQDNETRDAENLYSDALTSLNYLWDLLDLSTADNIALHINNHLCECEEYFYQTELQADNTESNSEAPPYSPTFFAHYAVLRAIQPLLTEPYSNAIIMQHEDSIHCDSDNQFSFILDTECELLGNENHLVLVMENLIKNALFYSNKIKPGNIHSKKYNRIALSLKKSNNVAEINIYNHGPAIAEDIKEQIFQLGYTTRRAKGEHGKGLGLYFVREIVNGYEGKIFHSNIDNETDSYSIRIELKSVGFGGNDIITNIIETTIDDNQLYCMNNSLLETEIDNTLNNNNDHRSNLEKSIEWKYSKAVKSIEITPRSTGITHAFSEFSPDDNLKVVDPNNPKIPRWALEVQPRKRSSKIIFIPLDITGVQFTVTLPCAGAQFDYEEEEIHKANDTYLNNIEDKFKPIDA